MTASELFKAGRLDEAVHAAGDAVKQAPTNIEARVLLSEMLCFQGEFERADKQLDVVSRQDPQSAPGVALFRQLIRAEIARHQFYHEGRLPDFLQQPTPALERHIEAAICIRAGDEERAAELLAASEEERPALAGRCGGRAFSDFRDADDLTACVFEVLTSTGTFYWIPMAAVESLQFQPVKYPRDILWRGAQMVVRGGPDGVVYLAARYVDSFQSDDAAVRLGQSADWTGGDRTPLRGQGLRIFLAAFEQGPDADEPVTLALPQISDLEFSAAPQEAD